LTVSARLPFTLLLVIHLTIFIASTLHAAESLPRDKPLYFIIDYLPAAIYERDSVTACFRIENASPAEIKAEFAFSALNETGAVVKEESRQVTLKPNAFTSLDASLDSRQAARMIFSVNRGARKVGSVSLRLVRDIEAWPATRWVGNRLTIADSGDMLIPTVSKRTKIQERAFLPVKWIIGADKPEASKDGNAAIVFAPAQWRMGGDKARGELKSIGPFQLNGSPPILQAADEILKKTAFLNTEALPAKEKGGAATAPPRLVLCLPPEDLEAATDPRLYRIVVDMLLIRATRLNVKKVILVPAFHYGAPEKFMRALSKEASASAGAYNAAALNTADFLNEVWWRLSEDISKVYGTVPNTTGLKNIEQGLFNITDF